MNTLRTKEVWRETRENWHFRQRLLAQIGFC